MFRSLLDQLRLSVGAVSTSASQGNQGFQVAPEDNSKYQTSNSRKQISSAAKKVIARFAEHAPVAYYEQAIEAHTDCFDCVVTDDEVKLGALENRPCCDGLSKVHKLHCGHHALCDALAVCGRNCQKAVNNNSPLYCLLCFRGEKARDQKRHPKRWDELLLPKHHIPEEEAKDWDAYKIVIRQEQSIYLNTDGTLVIPSHITTVMFIGALEKIREEQLKDCVRQVRIALEHHDRMRTAALDNLEILLRNHHLIRHVDLNVVGAFLLH